MSKDSLQLDKLERWAIRFEGIVQGVGFRPLVSVCAHRYGLGGFVYNDGAGVYTEVQGSQEALASFVKAIEEDLPRLAKINHKHVEVIPLVS